MKRGDPGSPLGPPLRDHERCGRWVDGGSDKRAAKRSSGSSVAGRAPVPQLIFTKKKTRLSLSSASETKIVIVNVSHIPCALFLPTTDAAGVESFQYIKD